MIEKITVYKYRTSDGKLFDDEEIAKIYETKLLSNRVDVFTNSGIKVEYEKKYINDLNEIYENNKHPEHIPGVYMHYYIPTGETYVGSTEDLYKRHSSFINLTKNKKRTYANKKIDSLKKRSKNTDWIFFVLKSNIKVEELLEYENFYIDKYCSIENGLNIRKAIENPLRHKTEELKVSKKEKERIKKAKYNYKHLVEYIKKNNCVIGQTLTEDIFVENFKEEMYGKCFCFKFSMVMKSKNIIEYEDLIVLDKWFVTYLNKPFDGFKDEDDKIPERIIYFQKTNNCYLPTNYLNIQYNMENKTINDAFVFKIESIRKKILERLSFVSTKDVNVLDNLINFIKNCSIDDIIKLKYTDYKKVIKFKNDIKIYA